MEGKRMIGYMMTFEECSGVPKYIQLYERLKEDILKGILKKGEKLPSVRSVSSSLGVSKVTVENAYTQLQLEGFVESVPKSGYYVQDIESTLMDFSEIPLRFDTEEKKTEEIPQDRASDGAFNFQEWKKALNHVLEYQSEALLSVGDIQGEYELRYEIAKFISQSRGVRAEPSQVVVGAGIQVLFSLLASFLRTSMKEIAFEYPGFSKGMYVFEDHGYETLKIPIEEDGLIIEELEKSKAKIVYVSPSHQYPTGSVMPIRKRMQLLGWAEREKGYIIEDDYDSILRYEGYPVPALQGISKSDRVIYAGSFSKLLIPSLRISFLILPRELLSGFQMVRSRYSQSVSKTEQLALAEYMRDGSFERHLRRIRILYKKKNQILLEAFRKYPSHYFELVGKESGLHVVLSFAKEVSIPEMVRLAQKEGIALEGVEEYQENRILVFSYSGVRDEEMEGVVRKLVRCSERAARSEIRRIGKE